MKKKIMSAALMTVLTASVIATGVHADEAVKVGYPSSPAFNEVMSAMTENRDAITEAAGCESVGELFEFNDATAVTAVENLITDGCKAISVTPFSDDVMYTITDMCDEAGVYFALSMRTIISDEVREYVEASDYFIGEVFENDYSCGYELGKALAESGATNYCLLTNAADNTSGQRREQGLEDAAQEFGLTCLDTYRNPADATEAQSAVETWIGKYGSELQGIIRLGSTAGGDVTAICAKLEENKDLGIKFLSADMESACKDYLASGVMYACGDVGNILDSAAVTVLTTRAALGNPISEEPVQIAIDFQLYTTPEDIDEYFSYVAVDDPLFTAEQVNDTLMTMDASELQDYINSLTPETVKEMREAR